MSGLWDRIRAFLSQSLSALLTSHLYLVYIGIGALVAALLCTYFYGYRIAIHGPSLIDWDRPQETAAITLSVPQVYSREALINDRRRETEYLEKLLRQSEGVSFQPHIKRAIDTVHALKLGVGVSEGETSTGKGSVSTGTQTSTQGKNDTKLSEQVSSSESNTPQKDGYPQERFRELQSYRNDIRASLARATLDDLHDYNGQALYRLQFHATVFPGQFPNKFGIAELTVTPPPLDPADVASIYLAWLGHATLGLNPAISRKGKATPLHFQENEDPRYQWLARRGELLDVMELLPRGVSRQEMWLLRIATPPHSKAHVETYLQQSYKIKELLQDWKGMAEQSLRSDQDQTNHLNQLCRSIKENKDLYDSAVRVYTLVPYLAASLKPVKEEQDRSTRYTHTLNAMSKNEDVRTLLTAGSNLGGPLTIIHHAIKNDCPDLRERFEYLTNHNHVPSEFNEKLDLLLRDQVPYAYAITPSEVTQRVSNVLSATTTLEMALALQPNGGAEKANVDMLGNAKETLEGLERIPLVVGFSSRTHDAFSKADSASPQKDASQASDVGNSPPVPQGGQKTEDASKRIPSRTPQGKECEIWGKNGCPTFGWVFGPKYRTHSKNRELEHVVASYDVAADLSIPGWWPFIPIQLRTVWVENWNGTSEAIKKPVEQIRNIKVRIPLLTPPDLESLTGALMTEFQGPWGQGPANSIITRIYPSAVSACSREVTFVIQGDNLWRDAEVYWEGVKGDQITVLPGMEGITAHFTLDHFFGAEKQGSPERHARKTSLLVATRGQQVTAEVMFYGHRYKVKKTSEGENIPSDIPIECDGPIVSAEPGDEMNSTSFPPKIHAVTPASLYACSRNTKVSFAIEGAYLAVPNFLELKSKLEEASNDLMKKFPHDMKKFNDEYRKKEDSILKKTAASFEVYWAGNRPKDEKVIWKNDQASSIYLLEATFESPIDLSAKKSGGLENIVRVPISVVTPNGIDSHDVVIMPCDSSKASAGK